MHIDVRDLGCAKFALPKDLPKTISLIIIYLEKSIQLTKIRKKSDICKRKVHFSVKMEEKNAEFNGKRYFAHENERVI